MKTLFLKSCFRHLTVDTITERLLQITVEVERPVMLGLYLLTVLNIVQVSAVHTHGKNSLNLNMGLVCKLNNNVSGLLQNSPGF